MSYLDVYKHDYKVYRSLLLIKMVMKGETIVKSSNIIGVHVKTGERWVKNYNKEGLNGLIPDYSNNGRKSLLSNNQLQRLNKEISKEEESYDIIGVQKDKVKIKLMENPCQ